MGAEQKATNAINVWIVSGTDVLQAGLCAIIGDQPDMAVTIVVCDTASLVRRIEQGTAGRTVALLSMASADMENCASLIREVLAAAPGARVAVLPPMCSPHWMMEAQSAGAAACLSPDCTTGELVDTIRTVASGGTHFPGPVDLPDESVSGREISDLTPRELEVLELLADGRNTKEIALLLGVSAKTVETHRTHVMEKLHSRSLADLTKLAVREGLTPLES